MRIFAYSESIYNHCFVCDLDHLPGVGVIPLLLSRVLQFSKNHISILRILKCTSMSELSRTGLVYVGGELHQLLVPAGAVAQAVVEEGDGRAAGHHYFITHSWNILVKNNHFTRHN